MSHCHPLTIFHTVFRINHTNPVDLPAPFDWPNKPNYPWPPPQPRFVFTRITMLSIYEIATCAVCVHRSGKFNVPVFFSFLSFVYVFSLSFFLFVRYRCDDINDIESKMNWNWISKCTNALWVHKWIEDPLCRRNSILLMSWTSQWRFHEQCTNDTESGSHW